MKSRTAIASLLFPLIWSSCGRPPGAATNYAGIEEAGVAAPAGAVQPGTKQQQQSKLQSQLQAKLSQLGKNEQQVALQLDGVQSQLADARNSAQATQSQMQAEAKRKAAEYSAQQYQYQLDVQNRKDLEGQLAGQIQARQNELNQLHSALQWEESGGYYNPAYVVSHSDVDQKAGELAALQAQYEAVRQQQAQAIADEQARSRWQEGADQSEFLQQYQQSYNDARKQVEDLSAQYQKLQQQDEQLWQAMSDVQDQLSTIPQG